MEKVKLTKEEFNAMKDYTCLSKNKSYLIESYVKTSNTWIAEYLPLKEMGLDKFCEALYYGYEMEIPTTPKYLANNIYINYNFQMDCMLEGKVDKNKIIYIGLKSKGFSIAEAKEISKALNELIEHYETYIQKD